MEKYAGFVSNIMDFSKNLGAKVTEPFLQAGEYAGELAPAVGQSFKKLLVDTAQKTGKEGLETSLQNTDLLRLSLPLVGAAGVYEGGKSAINSFKQQRQITASEDLVMSDPEIATADKDKAQGLFNTLKEYAPSIAKDPVLAKPFVQGMLSYATMDHKVIQDLMLSEKIYQELKGQPLTTLQAIRKSSWLV